MLLVDNSGNANGVVPFGSDATGVVSDGSASDSVSSSRSRRGPTQAVSLLFQEGHPPRRCKEDH